MTATPAARSRAALTAIMTGVAYATSAEMAGELGAFAGFAKNREAMLRVIRNHRRAAHGETPRLRAPVARAGRRSTPRTAPTRRWSRRRGAAWDRALDMGERHGFRNAQATVIAPTGTTGLVMDCDTTGIEPDFALVKFKKLAGGGYFRIINRGVPGALQKLGYGAARDRGDHALCRRPRHAQGRARAQLTSSSRPRASPTARSRCWSRRLAAAFDIKFAFNKWTLGEEFCKAAFGFTAEQMADPSFDMLAALGFTKAEIEAANT